jgi:outer membrane lipoprotein SlyB
MQRFKMFKLISILIIACFLILGSAVSSDAQRRYRHRRHNPEAGKGKAAKRIGIGAGAGAVIGGLAGGKKGAVIGAGVGAGAGGAYHIHKKRSYRRHHPR